MLQVNVPMGSDVLFCQEEHKHHLLYSGTQVLQVRGSEELPALVIHTGEGGGRRETGGVNSDYDLLWYLQSTAMFLKLFFLLQ